MLHSLSTSLLLSLSDKQHRKPIKKHDWFYKKKKNG